jgi:hypothetical protein
VLPDPAIAVLSALELEGVRYAVFGAMALGLHGLPRFTEDLDLFVDPSPENVARLRRALQAVFADPSIEEIVSEDLAGDYPAIQYTPPSGEFRLDILARLGDAFRFEKLETARVRWEDLEVTVVTPRQLFLMKRGTVRPKDRADAEALAERFGFGGE